MKSLAKDLIRPHFQNVPGKRIGRKIVVIQSDDWGAIRTSGQNALKDLSKAGIAVSECHYTEFDALEGSDDLNAIFEVLDSVRDRNGSPAKLTANCLVANPNFEAIEKDGFSRYSAEPVTTTFERSERTEGADRLWLEGYEAGLFFPQSHSREHLNVARWMHHLQTGDAIFRLLFKHRMYALSSFLIPGRPSSYLAALQSPAEGEYDAREEILDDGLRMFRQIIGFSSKSFIAPNYVWDDAAEDTLHRLGVAYIQTAAVQQLAGSDQPSKRIRRVQGQRNRNGQLYLMRNVHFEPSSDSNEDWISRCMADISAAFLWSKPAIISTHRVNFIGALDESNRKSGLKQLKALLDSILKRWPDVEFLSTTELGDLISNGDRT
jgi:hypothetical protein